MFEDPVNYLYFIFINPIMAEFKELNVKFQHDHADHGYLLNELEEFALGLYEIVLCSSHVKLGVDFFFKSIYLPLDKANFGYKFTNVADEYKKKKIFLQAACIMLN